MSLSKRLDKPLVIIVILYLFLSFFMITKFPRVWMDESWTAIPPYTLVTEGKFANPIIKGYEGGMGEHILYPKILQRISLAGVYKLFGFGLVQSRALSIFAGLLLILVTYWFAKNYYDQKIATLTIILLASDNVFFVTSRTVREDIFLAFFAGAAFFLFLHGLKTKSLRYFALSGIFMGISLYTHPNSFLVLVAIIIIFFLEFKFSMFISKQFWMFTLFCLIGFVPYAVYVIKEDYVNNFEHFKSQLGANADYLNRDYLQDVLSEYRRYSNYIYFPKRLLIFVTQLLALIYASFSSKKIDRYLVLLVVTFVFLLPLWNPANTTPRYFIVFIPAICIFVSTFFIDCVKKINISNLKDYKFQKTVGYVIVALIVLLCLVNQIVGDVYILWKHKDNNYYSFIGKIENTIPEHSKVWGSIAFWIGLYKYAYLTPLSPYQEVGKFRPNYIILYDSETWGDLSGTVERKANLAWLWADTRYKIEELSRERGVFVKRIDSKFYGNIEIYRVRWGD